LLNGKQGDHLLLAPPFIIENSCVEGMVDELSKALRTVL
tara:strand:+ start:321 stop:437 length:117 start_codon:yes stop_codon:yes gene_type:complete